MKTPRRPLIDPITVLLRGPSQDAYLAKVIPNLPHDPERPLQVLIREEPRKRKLSLNDAMWAGPLRDIAKHRNGPCGTIPLRWKGEISRYEEEERETESWVEPRMAEFEEAV